MSIKWVMFAVFLWLGVAVLAAGAEYAWIGDTEASRLYSLINGTSITGWATGLLAAGGVAAGIAALVLGNRALTAASVVIFIGFAIAFRDIMSFNYPTLFYGPYAIFRWMLVGGLGLTIFLSVAVGILRGGSSQ